MAIGSKSIDKYGIVEELSRFSKQQLSDKNHVAFVCFIDQYFRNVSIEDLRNREIEDLYGLVSSHWQLLQERVQGQCKVRVYNPDAEQHGWQSTHTVIEIIGDDMPFLVDSLRMAINRLGLYLHFIIHLGGIKVVRNKQGVLQNVLPFFNDTLKESTPTVIEAPIYLEIDRQGDVGRLKTIKTALLRVIDDVRLTVRDWQAMKDRLNQSLDQLETRKDLLDQRDFSESTAFIHWLLTDHFTFLGYREYKVVGKKEKLALRLIKGSGLGVLADETKSKVTRLYTDLPEAARDMALSKDILIISKTNTESTVHRPAYTDYIGIKQFDAQGNITGEHRIIGLFTSSAYNYNPKDIPMLRRKVQSVIKHAKLPPQGHAGKALLNILETFPRDDLFQSSIADLERIALGVYHLQDRQRVRLFVRPDAYGRYVSCFVYVPKDNFNSQVLNRIKHILLDAFVGKEISFSTYFTESVLVRTNYVVRLHTSSSNDTGKTKNVVDIKAIEEKIIEVARSWRDSLQIAMIDHFGEERGVAQFMRYVDSFPAGYRETFSPRIAVTDIDHIEALNDDAELGISFYRTLSDEQDLISFKLYRYHQTTPLSDALPILENMGLRVIGEQPYPLKRQDGVSIWVNTFQMEYMTAEKSLDIEQVKDKFQVAFQKVWQSQMENDPFNKLVLLAGLSWIQVTLLRAYAKYCQQIGFTFSQQYIAECLANYPKISRLLVKYFNQRLSPKLTDNRENRIIQLEEKITTLLDSEVTSLDEDRILRQYMNIIRATLRTSAFQRKSDGRYKSYVSFKFDAQQIPGMPAPCPKYEVFVYSLRFEGVHLRTAKVARGGLRWSDRREDFRTEVLGLMKAQKVKNAVIVPAGAKGGFVPKCLPVNASREVVNREGIHCYQQFIRALLDITDNIIDSEVVYPRNVVRYDDDDPYLVVAADKGTASFSDIANQISADYGFWLGDAFASGGSQGYDHKKMSITARGAWESVKQHFQALGKDCQKEPFTVVGIGDMSGDVFGNGMLLSKATRLLAAFNHVHVFIDPNPDLSISFNERMRLFEKQGSTWMDYNKKHISKGGGVFLRSAKSIKISKQMKETLNIAEDQLTPNQLIQSILTAPVDLLWNGGIGTYVKSSDELHHDVGDRTNDVVRVDARQLRCRIVGEGGNLGLTQLARIEYDLAGGRINTDFIDNSAGVDCSDHEVNLKVLLNELVHSQDMTQKQRNYLLAKMTGDVADLVLVMNFRQGRALEYAKIKSKHAIPLYAEYMQKEEQAQRLNRDIEFLPSDKTLSERKTTGQGLTRPELAVLLAYSKINLKQEILTSNLPEIPYFEKYLHRAFPINIRQNYAKSIKTHRLRRELIATVLSNAIVMDMGITFFYQIRMESGESIERIASAYAVAVEIFDLAKIFKTVDDLHEKYDIKAHHGMIADAVELLRRSIVWFLANTGTTIEIEMLIDRFKPAVQTMQLELMQLLPSDQRKRVRATRKRYLSLGIVSETAEFLALLPKLYNLLNIIAVSFELSQNVSSVAKIYCKTLADLQLDWLYEMISRYPVDNRWLVLARASYKVEIDLKQRDLLQSVLQLSPATNIKECLRNWEKNHQVAVSRWRKLMSEIRSQEYVDFAMLAVAMKSLRDLVQSTQSTKES